MNWAFMTSRDPNPFSKADAWLADELWDLIQDVRRLEVRVQHLARKLAEREDT